MKKYILLPLAFAVIAMSGCAKKGSSSAAADPEVKAESRIEQIENSDKIVWLSFEEALALNKEKPKKIFVDVYTNWCGWCKRMDQTTLQDDKIEKYLNEKYYSVKLNAESNKKVSYQGRELTEAELARDVFNATGYPTTVYLAETREVLQPVPGYLDVDMLDKILHFYGEDAYKTNTWEKYRMSYNPSE